MESKAITLPAEQTIMESVSALNKKVNYVIIFLVIAYVICTTILVVISTSKADTANRFSTIDTEIIGIKGNQQVIMNNQRKAQDSTNQALIFLRSK